MLEAFLAGAADVFSPVNMLVMLIGIGIGIIIGVAPVISGMVATVLVLPFVYAWPPEIALMLLQGIGGSGVVGGVITTILLNIPGEPTNVATLMDGYPMTQKGHGGRAIAAALTVKAMGGILAALLGIAAIPVIVPIVMAFRSPEMFLLILVGLSFMAGLASESIVKGLITGFLGIFISLIGFQAVTGVERFTFGSVYLYDGIPLVPFIVGLFALPELVDLMLKGGTIAQEKTPVKIGSDMLEGVKDVFRHFWLFIRSTVIGWIVGVIPGIGASVATFVSYAQAKQFSKHPEEFGKGCIEGVIAPECASSAERPGALLTTIAFGIPGSAGMTIMLAALILVGITPGPALIKEHLDIAFYLLISTVVIAIIASLACFFLARWLVKLAYVHTDFLVPSVLILVAVGAFAMRDNMMDVVVIIPVAVLGYALKKFQYPRASLILGFILGTLAEKYFFLSLNAFGPFFFSSPISIALIAMIILGLCFDPLRYLIKRLRRRQEKYES